MSNMLFIHSSALQIVSSLLSHAVRTCIFTTVAFPERFLYCRILCLSTRCMPPGPHSFIPVLYSPGRIPRAVASINQHLLKSDDVVSCCLDLGVPSISFRINGQPVQGMFENFNTDGLFFPVMSFSAGVK